MGCDIHTLVEVKENYTLIGELNFQFKQLINFIKSLFTDVQPLERKWVVNTEKVFPNPNYKPEGSYEWQHEQYDSNPDSNRNYDWFAILAGVRNGYGFAGVKTGQGFKVIVEPRGVPEDATPDWKEIVEGWDCDMHSHSWVTLEDFEKFDFNLVTMKTGVVPIGEYQRLRGTTLAPEIWSGGIMGSNIVTISQEKADEHLSNKPDHELIGMQVYVQYEWPIIYNEWLDTKIKNWVEPLKYLSTKYKSVRIVFGFDN